MKEMVLLDGSDVGNRRKSGSSQFFNFDGLPKKAMGNHSYYCFPEYRCREKPKAKWSLVPGQPFDEQVIETEQLSL